jgi:hypothetical protein
MILSENRYALFRIMRPGIEILRFAPIIFRE